MAPRVFNTTAFACGRDPNIISATGYLRFLMGCASPAERVTWLSNESGGWRSICAV